MSAFDAIILAILVASAGLGFMRGATREMISVIALLVAAVAALYGLKFSGPIGRALVNPDWLGTVVAAVGSFFVVYFILQWLGDSFAKGIQKIQVLGLLDRSVGLGFGLVRAFVFLGACNLAFNAATPPDLRPAWLDKSTFYPMTASAGALLKSLAPKGLDLAGRLKPVLEGAVRDGSANPERDSGGSEGYDARNRDGIDDLVEKSR